jgi:hypothetical protein
MSHSFTHHRHRLNTGSMSQENCLSQIVHKTGPGCASAATVVAPATGETYRLRMPKPSLHAHLAVYLIRFCKWPGTRRFSSPGTPAKFIAWHGETHRSPSHRCGRLCEWLVRRKDVRPALVEPSGSGNGSTLPNHFSTICRADRCNFGAIQGLIAPCVFRVSDTRAGT